jgi:hypothetical protein
MAKRTPKTKTPATEAVVEFVPMHEMREPDAVPFKGAAFSDLSEMPTLADVVELDPEVEEDNAKKNSVVLPKYKHRYAERAIANGDKRKCVQRSAWDWLAQTLAAQCLNKAQKIDIVKFCKVLELNGIDHSRWPNRSKGWEGRLRMTGRLALQRVVAESGQMAIIGDEGEHDVVEAPAEWIAKYRN